MLHDFVTENRDELIRRCTAKVALRGPAATKLQVHGVPLFLGQLVEALRREQGSVASGHDAQSGLAAGAPAAAESRRTAALHGKELLDEGYTVAQVVHGYGDVCQAITELARDMQAPVSVEEFHTFNRLLDNAIADAVSSYGRHRDESMSALGDLDLHERLGALADAERRLLDRALAAFEALKTGNLGLRGATGSILEDSLVQLRALIDKSLPEIRLKTGMTAPREP